MPQISNHSWNFLIMLYFLTSVLLLKSFFYMRFSFCSLSSFSILNFYCIALFF